MTGDLNNQVLEHLNQIEAGVNELKKSLTELNQQISSVDSRLAQVERGVANMRGDAGRAIGRTSWTDEERSAFCAWLAENSETNDIYVLPDFSNNPKSG
ncbi:MAG: hypothetical protein ABSB19_12955 [Methylomonas sp.]|jgi:peptidoglycan hydrolase CwlO-like protein